MDPLGSETPCIHRNREKPGTVTRPLSVGVRTMNESSIPAETGQAVIADLQRRLDAIADPSTKEWFEDYLKHAQYRERERKPRS